MSVPRSEGEAGGADQFATIAVHAGLEPDPATGAVIPPIHQSSTYVQPRVGELVDGYDYSRASNPTRAALERALGVLEGGQRLPSPPAWRPPTR